MDFKTLLQQITELYQKLTLKQKIIMASSVALVIGFLVFLILYKGPKKADEGYSVLFDKTSAEDSALIIQQLEKDGIPYKIVDEGTIKVPSEVVYKERIAIAAQGIPKSSKIGFELFDKQEFGATDFEQKIKYMRALEGELSRTIESLQPILEAKVHIALPKESVFVQKDVLPTASVVLRTDPSLRLTRKQIIGIKNLVSASVTKLSADYVKIVNQDGVPLGEGDDLFQSELVAAQIKYKKDYEKSYEEKIVNVLAPFIGGEDKVVAKVNIEFNFAREDITSEYYDPNSVPRSEQSTEEKREGTKQKDIGGVPGAVSNIGPVQDIGSKETTEKYQKSTTTTNYEISKKVSNIKGEFATIKRVTAAVVVDGKYVNKKDKDGNMLDELEYKPLEKVELDSIERLVKQSIGYSEARGDEVTISNFEFKPLVVTEKKALTKDLVDKIAFYMMPLMPFIKYLIAALILFILYKKVIVPFSQKMIEITEEEEEESKREGLFEEEEEGEDTLEKFQAVRKKVEEQLGIGEGFDEDELRYDVLLEKLKEAAEENPEEIAGLLQSLLKSETGML